MKKYLDQSLLLSFFLFLSAFLSAFLFPAKTCIFHAFLVLVGDLGTLFLVELLVFVCVVLSPDLLKQGFLLFGKGGAFLFTLFGFFFLFSGKSGPESDGASGKQYDEFLHYLYVFGFE
jgi:hypothetical protein